MCKKSLQKSYAGRFRKDDLMIYSVTKKFITLFLVLILISLIIPAGMCSSAVDGKGPSYEWTKVFGPEDGEIYCAWQLSDNTYVAGGRSDNGRELIYLSGSGDIVSKKDIPGGYTNGSIKFVQESPKGGLYLFTDDQNLIKTTVSGNVEWTYHLPRGVVSSVEVADNGDVMMSGDYLQSFLTKVNSEGIELWNKSLGSPEGGGQYRLTSVQSTDDGGFIIAGYINPIIYTEKYRGFVMKTDADGNELWAQQYNSDNSAMIITITPIKDGYYAAGLVEVTENDLSMTSDNVIYRSWIMVIDENGDVLSRNPVSDADMVYHIKSSVDGGYYLLANKYSALTDSTNFMLIKTDAEGSIKWMKDFGKTRMSSLEITDDGGLLLSGIDDALKEGILIKTLSENQDNAEVPGFGVFAAFSAILCALAVFFFKKE